MNHDQLSLPTTCLRRSAVFYDNLHCSFGNSHVEIVEHLVGLRFGSVGFEGMTHRDGILLPAPHRPAIIYRGDCLIAAPEKMKKSEPLINVAQALVKQEMNWNCLLKLKRKSSKLRTRETNPTLT